ncbi:hypothetical protein AAFC00_005105 [Neodothiora populina]|uniref:Mediator of RNA polymerase II transcription subunit 6 n=1 Tax=Neodothiora populina TaxID=2781224 RepID=A0ABR3PK60_9PEZI
MTGKYQNAPLDEVQFRRPEVIQWWGGISADTVHPIIRESPFFDHTSKNGLLWEQAQNDMRTWEICNKREAFETRLKSMNGVEYMIVGEPQKVEDAEVVDTGIWVIRKQERRKRTPREDDITVLGTYYIVGENMYQAPSVSDIIGNHMLSAMNSLSKLAELAEPLPIFTPALGYTFFPPAPSKAATSTQSPGLQPSREGSIAPPGNHVSQPNTAAALEGNPQAPSVASTAAQVPDPRDSFALFESLQMMTRYGDEYMDENPLRGEPGNFIFSATKERLRAKQAELEAAKAKEAEIARKLEQSRNALGATPFAASTTAAKAKADAATAEGKPLVKRSKTGERRKKRSRNATSPTSPMTPATPATPAS